MTVPQPQDVPGRIAALTDATARLEEAVQALLERGSDAFSAPSGLPGWTVGHVLTHLARNADGLRRVLAGAAVGQVLQLYASPQAREDDIQEGARRGADAIAIDVRTADRQLAELIAAQPQRVWSATIDLGTGGPTTADVLLGTRLAEVELHHHDLGVDRGLALLTVGQARELLGAMLRSYVRTRGVTGLTLEPDGAEPIPVGSGGQVVAGPTIDLVGWLSGRTGGVGLRSDGGLPELPQW